MLAMIDAGGTTFKCAVADKTGKIFFRQRIITTDPESTIRECVDFFHDCVSRTGDELSGMGVACFGPINVDVQSIDYGRLLNTPKPGWSNFPVRQAFENALALPVNIDTDVNAALFAETQAGSAANVRRAAYVTVGTGIGVSFVQDGQFIAKPTHSEFGHICVEKNPDDAFGGQCAYHIGCLEGLASAAAFEARWGDARHVEPDHIGWRIEADYLAQLCMSISLLLRPDKIILGGGLLLAPSLIDYVREAYCERMNGYLNETAEEVSNMIVLPFNGDEAGLMGAWHLALDAANRSNVPRGPSDKTFA